MKSKKERSAANNSQIEYTAKEILSFLTKKKEGFWMREREERALALFQRAAKKVPAYKDFLKKHKVNPAKIKTFQDFQSVPPTSKKTYLQHYPLGQLVWEGTLRMQMPFSATSGSTGKSFYFPRTHRLDWESSIVHEMFLRNSSHEHKKSTLVIVCFGMGVWIGGLITYKAFEMASHRGYPVSIITPGINKLEVMKALQGLSPHFEQTILAGYPPFLKDIIDEAPKHGIQPKKLNLRLLFAAEPFSEKFRDYLKQKASIQNVHLDTLNIYGTADIGTMAYETPTSILMRRLALRNVKNFNTVFTTDPKTPTLAQYNPLFITFESLFGNLFLTGNNAIPLIRYEIGDRGGVASFSEMIGKFKQVRVDFYEEAKKAHIEKNIYELPFVYVYERTDFSTTLYGLQIYPEVIREALLDTSVNRLLTGKFAMLTKFNRAQNQYLEINLELQKNQKETKLAKKLITEKIIWYLCNKNSEFRELYNFLGKRAAPKLVFWEAEHPRYFKPGVKQKWVIR